MALTSQKPRGRPKKSRPLPADSPSATANATVHHEATLDVIVRQGGAKSGQARGSRVPAAFAAVYEPCEGRTQWAFCYICPICKLGHLGRAKTEAEVSGPRRSRCGRLVVIRPARVYRSKAAA